MSVIARTHHELSGGAFWIVALAWLFLLVLVLFMSMNMNAADAAPQREGFVVGPVTGALIVMTLGMCVIATTRAVSVAYDTKEYVLKQLRKSDPSRDPRAPETIYDLALGARASMRELASDVREHTIMIANYQNRINEAWHGYAALEDATRSEVVRATTAALAAAASAQRAVELLEMGKKA